ncbi:MAG TPA: GNAT family N-acetyltransferase [Candidatus Baltobacteraceae bacterium]|jgi:ribosomal-protein-alanine N-acetyltransferase
MNHSLQTERLDLRLVQMGDAQNIFQLHQDPEVAQSVYFQPADVGKVSTLLYLRKILFVRGQAVLWVLLDRSGAFVGFVDLPMDKDKAKGEVHFIIAKPYRNRGYLTEALKAVFAFAKESLGLQQIEGCCFVENDRAAHVFEKLGFQYLGIVPKTPENEHDLKTYILDL